MIELYVALVALDALVILLLIGFRRRWNLVAGGIVLAFAVNVSLLAAVPDTSGYATSSSPPDEAPFIACAVDEPDYVYLWLVADDTPRAYRQPYSRDLHAVCETARQATQSGVAVGLRRTGRPGQQSSPGRFRPYQLPPPGQPKEGGE